jgi:hypothetical protein
MRCLALHDDVAAVLVEDLFEADPPAAGCTVERDDRLYPPGTR